VLGNDITFKNSESIYTKSFMRLILQGKPLLFCKKNWLMMQWI